MKVREKIEQREKQFLNSFATLSANSRGREKPEAECDMRTCFQRDRDRIIYSKSFRRLKNKTQVFFSPEGDHYITRLTHTLDVSQVARSIARCLDLNEDLAEAISLGHDLGHTPFGHAGERTLRALSGHFEHNEQSLRVVELLENEGNGLNLTYEVKDGIVNHNNNGKPFTLEGQAVAIADRIAYLNHDIDDAIRAGIITEQDLPKEAQDLGRTSSQRINAMITSIVNNSLGKNQISMTEEVKKTTDLIRKFMFERVYLNQDAIKEEERAYKMLGALYDYFIKDLSKLPRTYQNVLNKGENEIRVVCDYLSSMTDRYAVYIFEEYFIPKSFYIGNNGDKG